MSIEVRDLTVRYGATAAVDRLSLSIPDGCMFGLLGPNGAGKSSTIRCIATIQVPQAGTIAVGGHDALREGAEVRRQLGVVPQGLALYESLSVIENLRVFAGLYGLRGNRLRDRVDWGLQLAQLGAARGNTVGTLSGGMKRRLNLAVALLHDPRVLIFDEPTTGVDPQSRNHIFETIRALHREGRTIVYTTHYLEEVEALCERVAIVDRGRVLACDTLAGLLARARPTGLRVPVAGDGGEERRRLEAAGFAPGSIGVEGASLEQVFLDLCGRALRDEA